jgi:hypothetical protein
MISVNANSSRARRLRTTRSMAAEILAMVISFRRPRQSRGANRYLYLAMRDPFDVNLAIKKVN